MLFLQEKTKEEIQKEKRKNINLGGCDDMRGEGRGGERGEGRGERGEGRGGEGRGERGEGREGERG